MAALKMSSRFAAIASHNKDPSIWGWGLWYADKSGAWWGVGGMGKAPGTSSLWAGDYSESV
jgi:hypothetical protein